MRVAARLFAEHGIAGTSVRDIALEVGMLSGSLYHHFPSKDAIAAAVLGDFLTDLNARYESVLPHVDGLRARLRALIHESILVAEKHPYATEIYQNERSLHGPDAPAEIAEAVHRAHTFWSDTAQTGSATGELRAELEPAEFARVLRESVWWSVRYHRESLAADAQSITDTLFLVFVEGAATPDAAPAPAVAITEYRIADQLDRIEAQLVALSHDQSR
ncbi:TetR/AcrR family transcriptional regulator [Rhodococcus sp. UYP9]